MTKWKQKNKEPEGFTIKEGLETSSPDSSSDSPSQDISDEIADKLDQGNMYSSFSDPAENLRGEFDQMADSIDTLTSGISGIYNEMPIGGGSMDMVWGEAKSGFFDIKGTINTVVAMLGQFSAMISYFLQVIISYLILIKMTIELFILNFNNYLNNVLTKMANSLTQNTATATEVTTFKEQTQKFLMLLMSWIFVYNWYYVCFYLKEQDNIRYTFDANHVMHYSSFLYGLFGPSFRTLQRFNETIIGFAKWIQTTTDDDGKTVPRFSGINNLIYVFMFLLFFILVSANFQSILMTDFFNALRMQVGPSLMTGITGIAVLVYSAKYYWYESGLFEMLKWTVWPLGYLCFLLASLAYIGVTVGVQIPFAAMLIFSYLFIYSFFGVFLYQGTNIFNTFIGISSEVANMDSDEINDDICTKPTNFEFSWNYIWTNYIKYYGSKVLDFSSVYIFEIMIILLLLGGINIYSATFSDSIKGKVSAGSYSNNSLRKTLTSLFTWLILINILLIALIITFMVQKYKSIQLESSTNVPMSNQIDITIPSIGDDNDVFQGEEYLTDVGVTDA
jgi:hypothetical protein